MTPFDDHELIDAAACAPKRAKESLRRRAERGAARGKIDKLTPREFEVLRFVILGMLNKQIAAELRTAEKTIKVHRGRVMQKLGLTSVPGSGPLVAISRGDPAGFDMGPKSTIQQQLTA